MKRASKVITLTLVGSAAAVLSYSFGCRDDTQSSASTQPSGTRGHYHPWYYPSFFHGSTGSSGSGGSSTAHGFSSRGGFGSSGHAAGA